MLPSFDTEKAVVSSDDRASAVGVDRWPLRNRPVPYLLLLVLSSAAAASAAAGCCSCSCTLWASLRWRRPDACEQFQQSHSRSVTTSIHVPPLLKVQPPRCL